MEIMIHIKINKKGKKNDWKNAYSKKSCRNIAQTANKFESEISIGREDGLVNAKSIMGVITMAAGYNTTLKMIVEGSDESEAASAIEALFESKFEEE